MQTVQLIARRGGLDSCVCSLDGFCHNTIHQTQQLNQERRVEGGTQGRGREKLIPQCDAKGKGYLGWQMRNSFNYPPTGLSVVLSPERNILCTDRVPIGHGILGNWTRRAGLIEWEEEQQEQLRSECQLDDGGVRLAWQSASCHVSWVIYIHYLRQRSYVVSLVCSLVYLSADLRKNYWPDFRKT